MSGGARTLIVALALVAGGLVTVGVGATAPAAALDCAALGALDFPGVAVAGTLTAGSEICYTLPNATTGATIGQVVSEDVTGTVYAADQPICFLNGSARGCALTGAGPFTLRIANNLPWTASYHAKVFEMGTCPAAAAIGFGDLGPSIGATLPAEGIDCHDLDLAAGRYLMRQAPGYRATLYDSTSGTVACDYETNPDWLCAVPAGGYSLVVRGSVDEQTSYSMMVVSFQGTDGCVPTSTTDWASAPDSVSPAAPLVVDCHTVDAAPGSRRAIAATTNVYGEYVETWVLNADSDLLCAHDPRALGCELDGPGPYKILTSANIGYQLVARNLDADTDCPLITPRAFGKPADDSHPGIGCRRFIGEAGHGYFVKSLTGKGKDNLHRVYGPDLAVVGSTCAGGIPLCRPTQTGTQWVVTTPFKTSSVTAFVDLTSTAGCKTQPLDLTARTRSIALGEYDCATLDIPEGGNLGIVRDIRTLNEKPVVTVVDSAGEWICSTDGENETSLLRCPLDTGIAPYRAIVGLGPARAATTTAYLRLDKPQGCGKLATGKGVTVKLSKTAFARCYVVRKDRKRWEPLSVARRSGKAVVELGAATTSGGICSPYLRAASMTARCLMIPVSSPFTVVVTGNRKTGAFQLKRSR